MTEKLKLVNLNADQVALAKRENGERKKITHALVCGDYGQMFGTEKQCEKYFSAWSHIFPYLFSGGQKLNNFELESYKTTPELVMVLIDAHASLEKAATDRKIASISKSAHQKGAKKGFLARLLGI